MSSIIKLSLSEIASKIRSRELTSVQVVNEFADVIEAKQNYNAVFYFDRNRVLLEAAECDREADESHFRGRLHGVPLMIKDNIHVKDLPNSAGSPALKDFVPTEDAPCVTLLRNEGFILMGKTSMHELALGVTNDNTFFGRVGCAFSLDHSAGGSSGGTGAAIGTNMVPAGLGSDTGGSVRIPASVNGIAGLRPTLRRHPSEAVTPICFARDTIGPMARTVKDLVLLDEILSGEKYVEKYESLKGVRLGISEYLSRGCDPEIESAFERTKQMVVEAGAELVQIDDFHLIGESAAECGATILFYGPMLDLPTYLDKFHTNLTLTELVSKIASTDVKTLYDKCLAGWHTREQYDEAMSVHRPALIKAFYDLFAKNNINAILCPTLTCLPIRFEDITDETLVKFIHNTNPGSVAGMPGLSLPMGKSKDGLPIGLSLDGLENSDQELLCIGQLIEQLFLRN